MPQTDVERAVVASENVQRWIQGKTVRKVIVIPDKLANVVVS